MREDSNRVINHMEKLRRAEQAQRDRDLAAMQDNAAYKERMKKENHQIRLYNETQQAKAQQQVPQTQGAGEVFTGLLQFSNTLAKAVTEEANRQTKRNVAAALAEPISIEQELATARARRAQTYGGIIQTDNIVENAFRTGEDPIETTKSHVSNPAIVGRAAQVYDNRRATAIYSALRDDYLFSTEKQFTAADGTPFSGRETVADADLTRQFQARLKEDLLIAMGNPKPTYLAEAFKEIDASNKVFVDRARTEQKKRYDAEVKQQVDTLFSSNDYQNVALGIKQNIANFGYPATVDRVIEELEKPSSDEQLLTNFSLKGDGVPLKTSHPGKVAAALRERDKEQDSINRVQKRLNQDEFDSAIIANRADLSAQMNESAARAEAVYYELKVAAEIAGVDVPTSLKQMYSNAVEGNTIRNKLKVEQAAANGVLDEVLLSSLKDSGNISLGKELLKEQRIRDYGELWASMPTIIEAKAKELAEFSDPSKDATNALVEELKIEISNWVKGDIKVTKNSNATIDKLNALISSARDGGGQNPFSYTETGKGREFVNIAARKLREAEMPNYIIKQSKNKTLGQVAGQPYLLVQDNEHEEALSRSETGLPIQYTDAVRQVHSMFRQRGLDITLSQVHNEAVMANNKVSGKNLPLLDPTNSMVAMYDGMSTDLRRAFDIGVSNGVVKPIQRALSQFTGNAPRRPSMGAVDFTSQRNALETAANKLGVDPLDLATIIGFETGGTYDPGVVGGEGDNYQGLIQFGGPEREAYGVVPGMTFEEQLLGPVVRYLEDRFAAAGMSTQGANLLALYTTVLAGNPGANPDAKDSFGTSARDATDPTTKKGKIMAAHREAARKRYGF